VFGRELDVAFFGPVRERAHELAPPLGFGLWRWRRGGLAALVGVRLRLSDGLI
jgi:hypothetical protein